MLIAGIDTAINADNRTAIYVCVIDVIAQTLIGRNVDPRQSISGFLGAISCMQIN